MKDNRNRKDLSKGLSKKILKRKKALTIRAFDELTSGPDGTRTRDPMRDRHVF